MLSVKDESLETWKRIRLMPQVHLHTSLIADVHEQRTPVVTCDKLSS